MPYKGMIHFFVVLFLANIFWKLTISGDETDNIVSFLGINLTSQFNIVANDVTSKTYAFLHFMGSGVHWLSHNILKYDNGVAVRIVWSCTPIKQAFIFLCIIFFYKGYFIHKLWFMPLGLIVIYFFNIFRISAIVAIIENHPESFEFFHVYFFKYVFYAVIFAMWIFWEEKIVKRKRIEN